jgi:hypothetical protein
MSDDYFGTPNPGSDAALDMGCQCPVLDNGHGRRAPYQPDGWWITQGCPVHNPPEAEA